MLTVDKIKCQLERGLLKAAATPPRLMPFLEEITLNVQKLAADRSQP